MHDHEYDAAGRLVRTVVSREAEWDDDERALMLALGLYRAQLCPNGHWLPESADPAAEGRYRGRNSVCHACTAVVHEVERFKDHATRAALLFGAERR